MYKINAMYMGNTTCKFRNIVQGNLKHSKKRRRIARQFKRDHRRSNSVVEIWSRTKPPVKKNRRNIEPRLLKSVLINEAYKNCQKGYHLKICKETMV